MNLDSLNKWLMLAANIGVLAGIVFLGLEIRQNSDALISASRQGLLEADLVLLDNAFDYPEVYALNRGYTDIDALSMRSTLNYVFLMRTREFAWQQFRSGLVDEETFLSYLAPAISALSTDQGHDFLQTRGYQGDPEFIDFVKTRLGIPVE